MIRRRLTGCGKTVDAVEKEKSESNENKHPDLQGRFACCCAATAGVMYTALGSASDFNCEEAHCDPQLVFGSAIALNPREVRFE